MYQPINAESSLAALCRQTAQKLERAARLHPREIEKEIAQIQRDVVRLRDGLIDEFRQAEAFRVSELRRALEGVNVALSLIVCVVFPITSIQRSAVEQARETLKKLLA